MFKLPKLAWSETLMSNLHLISFQQDVQGINSGFRASTSSLKGLIRHLVENTAYPVRMTMEEALRHCSSFRSARIDKYHPAIERLVGVWGDAWRPYPSTAHGNQLSEVEINRICFRGDLRPPDVIFKEGFLKRDENMAATYRSNAVEQTLGQVENPVLDPIEGFKKAGDLISASAVCVTPDLHVAALFPLPIQRELHNNLQPTDVETWIYMVHTHSGYHTHARQILDGLAGLAELRELEQQEVINPLSDEVIPDHDVNEARVDVILQNLYGQEMAVDQVTPDSILFAFKVSRTWNATKRIRTWTNNVEVIGYEGDYKEGGTYTVLDVVENFGAIYPSEASWSFVAAACSKEVRGNTYVMPTHRSGFVPSTIQQLI